MSNNTHNHLVSVDPESTTIAKDTDSNGFFDKLAACLPPEEFNSAIPINNDNKNGESLSDTIDHSKNYQETLLNSEKTQKSELELLKEKIMKLEQRNNELEKKLTTNIGSKDNSLNDSFNPVNNSNVEDSFKNKNSSDNQVIVNSNISNPLIGSNLTGALQQNTTNIIFNSLNKSQINTNTNSLALKNIPNINQGGFIITSTGSIAYVPPSVAPRGNNSTSTPIAPKATSSNYAPHSFNDGSQISINDLMSSSFASKKASDKNQADNNSNVLYENGLKLDFDSLANSNNKSNVNLDLSSFLKCNKNIFNMNSTTKSSQSPTTSPQKSDNASQRPTAFILSANGQLLPINNSKTSAPQVILPKPQLLPKPSTASPSVVDLKLIKPKSTKTKGTKKQKTADLEDKVEAIPQPVVPAVVALAPNDSASNNLKHRAIRPKPTSNTNQSILQSTQHKNIQPKPMVPTITVQNSNAQQVLVLPNGTITTSPTSSNLGNNNTNLSKNFGIIKINTISPAKDNKNGIMLEANDILSKAASMIFSPSDFTLNNISPSNSINTNTNMVTTSQSYNVLFQNTENQINSSGKIAIQRNTNQQNSSTKINDTSLLKPAKIAIPKNPKATPKTKLPDPVKTTTNNKIAIAPNKPPQNVSAPSKSAKIVEVCSLNQKSIITEPTGQQIILNGINLTVQQQSTEQDPFTNLCNFGSIMANTNLPPNLSTEQKQQDLEIQLQLQSIMNGTAGEPVEIRDTTEKSAETNIESNNSINIQAATKTQTGRTTPEIVESMPSLDDFFNIGLTTERTTPKKSEKVSKTKSKSEVATDKSDKKSPTHKKSPVVASKKDIQIRPKTSSKDNKGKPIKPKASSVNEIKHGDKIKFELSDLDKVLQQVESITPLKNETSAKLVSHDHFMLDLLNIENSAPTVEDVSSVNNVSIADQISTPTIVGKSKKVSQIKKSNNSPSVLSTPPSLNSNNKPKKIKSTKHTPIKSQQQMPVDDDDFFSFLKETGDDLKRAPLKPDNHIQELILTKKRGRPSKPSLKNKEKQLSDNELDTSQKKFQDDCELEINGDTNSSSSETKCILNAAVENTFQDLINNKSDPLDNFILNGKSQREKSCESVLACNNQNNKENTELNTENIDDFNNFVYDIADSGNVQNTSMVTEDVSADITIASLMSAQKSHRKRGRGAYSKPSSEQKSNMLDVQQEAAVNETKEVISKESNETEEEDCSKRRKQSSSELNENELLIEINSNANEFSTTECMTNEPTIAALASSLPGGEKRKRGRPTKQAPTQKPEENKALNYKKINNPCGTTSLLALHTPPSNIEYAGLTRFEIPFEIEQDTKENDASPNKQAKVAAENDSKEAKGDDMELTSENMPSNSDAFIENIHKSIMNLEEGSNKDEETSKSNDNESKASQKEGQKEILDNLYETAAAAVKSFHSENSFEEKSYSAKDLFNATNSSINNKNNQVRETTESNVNAGYWLPNDSISPDSKKDLVQKKTHLSHYDLENDPIINKDLQELHSKTTSAPDSSNMQHQNKTHLSQSHYISNITNQPLITPSPTVCSVPSSVSSNASQFSINSASINKNSSTNNNSLSINPSSTSSTSSTQMISPVSSDIGNIRSTSVDQSHQYSNMPTNSYYNITNNQSVQHAQNSQMNSYYNNGFNQYNNPASSKPSNKSSTPTKYSNSSYSEVNSSLQNLDMNVQHSHQQATQPTLNLSSNNLYRSNSSSSLQPPNTNSEKTLTQNTSQLNTSQSPQQRNSLSLCSTPQPPPSKTPQPPTTPSHIFSSHSNPSATTSANNSTTHSQKTSTSSSSKPTTTPNMYQPPPPHPANMYQHNPFTQASAMPPAFPLLSNQTRADLYDAPDFSYQYTHTQPHLSANQYKAIHAPKSGQYEPISSYMQSTNQQTPGYYVNQPHQPTYLPNLLAPAYPLKNDLQTQSATLNQASIEPQQKTTKSAKTERKAPAKQAKKNPTKTATPTATPITGPASIPSNATPSYSQQPSNSYEKMMSVNSALHHAAWYDLQAQLGTAQQNSQYNQQVHKNSLNSLFASSTVPLANPHKAAKVESAQRASAVSSNQHHTAYQSQSHGQYQHSALNQSAPNYPVKDASSITRSSSSNNLDEPLYNHRPTTNQQHQETGFNLYNQYHHNLSQQNTIAANSQHFPSQQNVNPSSLHLNSHQQSHLNNVHSNQFNPQSHHQNQFNHYSKSNTYGVTAAHHHLTNSALAFPHHPHHQAVAMNSLLANQFSNVSPFNWHPKI